MIYELGKIFDLQMGKTPARKDSSYWKNGSNKWVSIADLSKCNKYIENTKESITDNAITDTGIKIVPKDTVIMSFKLTIGKLAITSEDMYTNEAIMALHDKHVVDLLPEYTYYLIKSLDLSHSANKAVMGKTLNKATLSKVKVSICSLEKQKQIINALSLLDQVIEYRNKQLEKLDLLVKAKFLEMFGETSDSNKKVPLNELCSSIVRGPFGSSLKKEFFVPESSDAYKVYEQKHAINKNADIGNYYINNNKFDELKRFECFPGDYIMSCSGTIGKLYRLPETCKPGIINQALCKFTLNDKLRPVFFEFSMKNAMDKLVTKGSGIKNLGSVKYLKNMCLNVPALEEQLIFEAFYNKVCKCNENLCLSLSKLEILQSSLRQKYFN